MTEFELTGGTDWGAYLFWDQRIQFNWRELYDKADTRFAIFRSRQEQISDTYGNYSTLRNIAAAREVLPVVAVFDWHYPDASQKYWLNLYKKAHDVENPDFIAVDLEQTQVWNGSTYAQVDPQKFSDTAQELCEGLRDAYPEKRVIPYTRRDILTHYSPPMTKWFPQFDGGWEAGGTDYGLPSYSLTWDQIKSFMCKVYPVGNLARIDNTGSTTIPTWTHNKFRQYSGRILYPYPAGSIYSHQYDSNVFYGTEAELIAWVKKTPAPVELTLEQRVADLERRVTALELH